MADLLGPVITELRRTGHPHVVNRLNDRANLFVASGQLSKAGRDAVEALDWGERTGNEFGLQTAKAIRFSISLLQHGFDDRRRAEGEALWEDVSSSPLQTRWLPYYASRMAGIAFELGADGEADRWIDRMNDTQLATDAFGRVTGWQVEAIEIRRLVRTGELAEAERRQGALGAEIEENGLLGLERRMAAVFATDWLRLTSERDRAEAELGREHQRPERQLLESSLGLGGVEPASTGPDQLRIETLAGVVSIAWGADDPRTLTGIPAKLLALLVADGGSTSMERCLDVLWPEADLDTARNRFHGVTRRLRRKLGLEPDGPLRVVDGVVSLGPTVACALVVDAWQLEVGILEGVAESGAGFCAAQFPYDDFAVETRHVLRAKLDALLTERDQPSASSA